MNTAKIVLIILIIAGIAMLTAITDGLGDMIKMSYASENAPAAHNGSSYATNNDAASMSVSKHFHNHNLTGAHHLAKGDCSKCGGTGLCHMCSGTGRIDDRTCNTCSGTGRCFYCGGDGDLWN